MKEKYSQKKLEKTSSTVDVNVVEGELFIFLPGIVNDNIVIVIIIF